MPFWWRRRRKPWYGRWRRRRFQRYKGRKRRRRFTRRRNRRPTRRRRRRRYKVRRKKQKIPVMQWQPDSIRKCKIKGVGILILGAEGTQMDCFTVQKTDYVPPKIPWGGGFGVENFTLSYLYEEHKFTNNIWTHTNIGKDLVRYLHCKINLFRHPDTDFVVNYNRQPPHRIDKWTFPSTHPQMLLLQKHKKIILSKQSKPNGKYVVKLRIKPPKQMLTKWFFSKPFCESSLVLLQGAAANFRYSHLTGKNTNMQVTIYSLNIKFYQIPNWANAQPSTSGGYLPYPNITLPLKYVVKDTPPIQEQEMPVELKTNYEKSVAHDTGWFKPQFLLAKYVKQGAAHLAVHQTIAARYNPLIDDGKGNEVYVVSNLQNSWKNVSDKQFLITDTPLWLALFGYYSFILTIKTPDYLKAHVVVLKSKAIYCYPEIGSCDLYCPIDWDYMTGKKPYEQVITKTQLARWYPDMSWQKKTLNAIVECGPFIPQYSDETYSTWELKYDYSFYFKWGGPHDPEQEIKDPKQLDTYDVPDTMPQTIQIRNPAKQTTETILHPWDFRRGIIKKGALKRMYQNLETDTEFQYSPEETPQKKRRGAALRNPQEENQEIQECLQALCEKSTCQEEETKDLQQLIQQQQHQQQELKYSILKLLFDLKEKQRMLQYHTGLLE
nr:MAG: ORF1 [Torque teno midi virus]